MRGAPAPSYFNRQEPSPRQPGQRIGAGLQQTPALGKQLITNRTVFTELQSASMGERLQSHQAAGNNEPWIPLMPLGKTRVPTGTSQLRWHSSGERLLAA